MGLIHQDLNILRFFKEEEILPLDCLLTLILAVK